MPNNFPMGGTVLWGSCPRNRGIALGGNCPTGVMVLGGQLSCWVIVSPMGLDCEPLTYLSGSHFKVSFSTAGYSPSVAL